MISSNNNFVFFQNYASVEKGVSVERGAIVGKGVTAGTGANVVNAEKGTISVSDASSERGMKYEIGAIVESGASDGSYENDVIDLNEFHSIFWSIHTSQMPMIGRGTIHLHGNLITMFVDHDDFGWTRWLWISRPAADPACLASNPLQQLH